MDGKQLSEQFRQMAMFVKVQSFGSYRRELTEHVIIWTLIPTCIFILARTYILTPCLGWWEPQVIGGFFFCLNWFFDQEHTGNFVWHKRIAHLAIAYIIALTYNLDPLMIRPNFK